MDNAPKNSRSGRLQRARTAIPALSALLIATGAAPSPPPWPDTHQGRLAALATIQSLELMLLSRDSATLALDDWCAAHALAAPGTKVIAERVVGLDKPVPANVRRDLATGESDPIRYRRVRLKCGPRVLSEADNWYVASRLTPAMNATLDTSDISFGRVVQPLHFHRQTLSAKLLWSPLPEGWETGKVALPPETGGALAIPRAIIENRGLLLLPDGTPFSEVVETYTSEVLDFAPGQAAGR